jgi:dihydrolipoamide dehydrogenase
MWRRLLHTGGMSVLGRRSILSDLLWWLGPAPAPVGSSGPGNPSVPGGTVPEPLSSTENKYENTTVPATLPPAAGAGPVGVTDHNEEVVPTSEQASTQEVTAGHHDVVIIGGGPGGYAAALYGAAAGLDVAMIEKGKIGGTCLHVGCIPAKELLETASVYRTVRHAAQFGITTDEPVVDWGVTIARKQGVIDNLTKGLTGLLKGRKVTLIDGVGRLGPNRTVTVSGGASGELTLTADAVVIATGSVPRTLPGFDIDGTTVVTSDEFLSMPTLPRRAAVIGGGAIGCEFASTMADMGTEVTIIEALPKILPGCDADITKVVERSFTKRKIAIRTGARVAGHTPGASGGTTVHVEDGDDVEVDIVVMSVGRRPFTYGVLDDGTAVKLDERGFVVVDGTCRTGEDGVWAVGDVIDTPALAHIGFAEGMLAIKDILGEDPAAIDHTRVPWCIYCHPEVAFAGHSEESARDAGLDVVTSKHRYIGNGRAQIVGDTDGMVKVIALRQADGTGGQIVGVHMVGPWVTEQLGQAYLAVNWEATVDEVAAFIQPHPTLSELFGETVLSLTGRSLHG